MPRKIQMMSGDSHLDFSPERWVHRVPAKWRERAPRRIKLASGDDAFIIENRRPHSPTLQITGTGRAYDQHDIKGISYDGPGTGAPEQRLREQDQDGRDQQLERVFVRQGTGGVRVGLLQLLDDRADTLPRGQPAATGA